MTPFTRAKINASIKHPDHPEMSGHSSMTMIAMVSEAAESKDMEQDSGRLAPSRQALMDGPAQRPQMC